jgi:hypothetical protein
MYEYCVCVSAHMCFCVCVSAHDSCTLCCALGTMKVKDLLTVANSTAKIHTDSKY